jgi:type II secretory pathway predicted ATPase ExeA
MYEKFYQLRERPFALAPDATFLFLGRHHRHALTMLEYAVVHGVGFALVTGEIGSGKTTLVRRLIQSVDSKVAISLITNTHRAFGSLLPWVAHAAGLRLDAVSAPQMYEAYLQHLAAEYVAGRRVVLIVDEAQNLGPKTLEELRVLSNVNADGHTLLQTILVGQPELRATLQRSDMRQFAQRIAIDYHLGNFSAQETQAYVRHRLTIAGGLPDLISAEAVALVHTSTGGVPRLINILCDMALVYGFAEQQRRVDAALMAQVVQERVAGGLLPLFDVSCAAPAPLQGG